MNKPSLKLGSHSQRAHNQCESEFNLYKECCGSLMCCQENVRKLMECLEKAEPTPPACLSAVRIYNKCWVKDNDYKFRCSGDRENIIRCMRNPGWYGSPFNVFNWRSTGKRYYDQRHEKSRY